MKTKNEIKLTYSDYKTNREISHRIDCRITGADFITTHPNIHRIDNMMSDIHRYLKHAGGKL